MPELKPFDDTPEPDEDSYETPPDLLVRLAQNYSLEFHLDAAANEKNKVCGDYLNDALHSEWVLLFGKDPVIVDVWCNPPHSLTEEFVRRADAQHQKWNMNICMITPTNCQSASFWQELIENEIECFVENHPIAKRPHFLKNGKKTRHPSRNAYRVIIWRKKHPVVPGQAQTHAPIQ